MRRTRGMLVCALLATMLLVASCRKHTSYAPSPQSLDILCLGDSITAGTHGEGDSGQGSYPDYLKERLPEVAVEFNVVNKGRNGWTILDIQNNLSDLLKEGAPDIILLQIGTNDLEQGATPLVAGERLNTLIGSLLQDAPGTQILVASVTRVRADNKPHLAIATETQFNSLVPGIVRSYARQDKPVYFVDMYKRSDFQDDDLGPDGEHPDDSGYQKMARVWFDALQRRLARERRDTKAPAPVPGVLPSNPGQ